MFYMDNLIQIYVFQYCRKFFNAENKNLVLDTYMKKLGSVKKV